MKKPNTFIIGAPKCGTTALCAYLSDHSDVFMCDPKEPHFFAHKAMQGRKEYIQDTNAYLQLFEHAHAGHKVVIEGSVWYLFCDNAVQKIKEFNKNAKLIIMLRRPDQMVHSFHSEALVNFDEDILDFSDAWKAALNPLLRTTISKKCTAPQTLQYDKIARYGQQLKKVYKYFPKEQVHIIFYDDFQSDTPKSTQDALSFLNLEPSKKRVFERVNSNRKVKFRTIGQFLEHPPELLMCMLNATKTLLGIKEVGLRPILQSLNTKTVSRPKIDEAVRLEIINHYKDDIKLVEKITERQLPNWLK